MLKPDLHVTLGVVLGALSVLPVLVSKVTWHEGETVSEVVTGEGNYAYVAAGSQGLYVIDVSDPERLSVVCNQAPGRFGASEGVAVVGKTLYLSNRNHMNVFKNGLYTYDVIQPAHPRLMDIRYVTDMVEDVTVSGDYVALANTASGVVLFDIADGGKPRRISDYPSSLMRVFTLFTGL